MAWLGVITALLWMLLAFLIAISLLGLQAMESIDPQIAVGISIGDETRRQLMQMAALYLISGILLLAASWTAFAGRYVTRFLHNTLAVMRLLLLILWAVDVARSGGSTPVHEIAPEMTLSPMVLMLMGALELIYPAAILILFNKPARVDTLRNLAR